MSLAQLLPSARLLNAADKLHLIRVLAMDIDDADAVQPLEHARTYRLQSPQFEAGAAEALMQELNSVVAH
ncbi:MAG TPA: hypothetical protein DDZ88_25260 [Verrucomicrobiales bacterium]|nr:hypothetical protein [Verrucomicrobiales bacterium]